MSRLKKHKRLKTRERERKKDSQSVGGILEWFGAFSFCALFTDGTEVPLKKKLILMRLKLIKTLREELLLTKTFVFCPLEMTFIVNNLKMQS